MSVSAAAFVQSIRGPIMLITLGLLLAIDHVAAVDFWRTWPVLVIVFGVLKLAETLLRRPARDVARTEVNLP